MSKKSRLKWVSDPHTHIYIDIYIYTLRIPMTHFPGETCHDRKNLSFDDLTFWRSDWPFFRSMFNAAILSLCWSWQQCRWVAAKENSGRWTGHTTHIHTYICFRYPSLQQASWQRWAIWSCWSIKFKKMKKSSTNPKLWSPHSLQLEHTVGPSASEVELAYSHFLVSFFWNTCLTISEAGTLVCGLLKQLSSWWRHVGAHLEIQKMLQQNVFKKMQSILTVFWR